MKMSSAGNEPESPPITLADLNLKVPPERVQSTICGKVRSYSEVTKLEWFYIVFSFLALATCFGLTIQRLTTFSSNTDDFTFAMLLLLTVVFCCYYVAHSVLTERGDELLVFVVSNGIVFIYCVVNYISQDTSVIKTVRLAIVCSVSPFLMGMGIYLSIKYFRSNNLICNTVGAIADLQKACQYFFFCSSLLEFDLQLQLSMLILVMGKEGNAMSILQKSILGSGVFLTVVFITLGFFALRRESVPLIIMFYILGLFEPGYVAYKFYYAGKEEDSDSETYESTFVCGCFALAIWLMLMGCTWYYSTHFFNKGLKEKLHGYQSNLMSNSASVGSQNSGS